MIILYAFIKEDKHQDLLNRYSDISTKEFKEKILKYRRWQDAQLSLLGRVLLKYGLSTFYDIKEFEICYQSDKKPFLEGKNIYFNISHTNSLVTCVIADFPIGIDVEFLDKKINYLDFKPQMTFSELYRVGNSKNTVQGFFSYWTEKEAVIKAHGKGLLIPLKSFEISNNECIVENEKFYLKEIFIDKNYQCCIAANSDRIKHETVVLEELNLNTL
ncbi:4'-phosphopantetheinyl transferase family protein [Flavobacterium pectinovorum]|uniref:4'-phosphopantetheinyl transferase n=1 Tax=Flavobacterium pectinovorum TaxID=29533 RepID=A0AB36NV83_9FLAO|nr:4'-phosphopantetheinyl transferase superfamily protein [Flavobacterium pectinovorum]OXA98978.1 hypothetical protein B0A72_22980 [Flavobacterium pectinovorum]SHN22405.1 4'-phosphopantetheinyl transferase [Flavobacterium pectinovorum]